MCKTKVWNLELTTVKKTTVPLAVLLRKNSLFKAIPSLSILHEKSRVHQLPLGVTSQGGGAKIFVRPIGLHLPQGHLLHRWTVKRCIWEHLFLKPNLINGGRGGGLWMMGKSWNIWKIGLKSSLYNQLSCLKHSLHLVIGFSWCNGRVIVSPGRAESGKC